MSIEPHIALLIMCKNETKRFHVTLNSVLGYVNSIVIYDTGSTDDTIDIVQNFSIKNNIPLHLKKGEFVNFSVSRNISLDFADEFIEIDYLLLLDVNDELKGGTNLRQFCKDFLYKKNTGFLVCQQWLSNTIDNYFNMRLIKPRSGWRYKGSVHEYLTNIILENSTIFKIQDNIILYQDRTQDDNKSFLRFSRDKLMLLEEHKNDQTEPRTVFYLAQTCGCLRQLQESFYYYKLRSKLEGFQEEKFHSLLRCGDISLDIGNPWHDSFIWYMKAYEHSRRVEPIVKIIEYYNTTKQFDIAFFFSTLACSLNYPEHCILFVEKHSYEYKRWHLMSVCAYNTKQFEIGRHACNKVLESGFSCITDTEILHLYNKEQILPRQSTKVLTKDQFLKNHVDLEFVKINNKLTKEKLLSNAKKLWKIKLN